MIGFVECWLVGILGFGVVVTIWHPVEFIIVLVVTSLGIAATGLLMASIFVAGQNVRSYQNALSYPLFLLGGVMVPASMLPYGFDHVSKLFFLSWATDLLRNTVEPSHISGFGWRLGVVVILSALPLAASLWIMRLLLRRIRTKGTVGYL